MKYYILTYAVKRWVQRRTFFGRIKTEKTNYHFNNAVCHEMHPHDFCIKYAKQLTDNTGDLHSVTLMSYNEIAGEEYFRLIRSCLSLAHQTVCAI